MGAIAIPNFQTSAAPKAKDIGGPGLPVTTINSLYLFLSCCFVVAIESQEKITRVFFLNFWMQTQRRNMRVSVFHGNDLQHPERSNPAT